MWKGWNKYVDTDDSKRYELLVGTSKVRVSLGVYLTRVESDPLAWRVLVNSFNPLAGGYIIYEGVFQSLSEAEEKAWEKAHAAAERKRSVLQ
jgi:hypothetical protein